MSIMIVTVISALSTILFFSVMDLYRIGQENRRRNLDRLILNEGATSAFAVMESALSRRLWKQPLDASCRVIPEVTATGSSDGVNWTVTAAYRPATKGYDLTVEASYKGMSTVFIRSIKTMDVSDYMVFSESTDPVYVTQSYNSKSPAGMISRDRRMYTKGPLVFYSHVARYDAGVVYNAPTTNWPGEWGGIVQGDRLQFLGGIYYNPNPIPVPNNTPGNANLPSLLAPYVNLYSSNHGGGVGLILKDATLAEGLWNQVRSGDPSTARRSQVAPNVYPLALFGGSTPPLLAWNGVDGTGYFSDPMRMPSFVYSYGGASSWGTAMNGTCISRPTAFADKKYCSHSAHFPKSFDLWRKNAGLEGTLFTDDAEASPAPQISQEHMASLEEDARRCGLVIENPLPTSYMDCPIWERGFYTSYTSTGTANCQRISVLDLDAVSWPTFDASGVQAAATQGQVEQKIIYSKVPLEIIQNKANGLMTSRLPNNTLRTAFSLWVINEQSTILRGVQPDTSSPLVTDPARLREIYFNRDTSGSGLRGLKLTLLSPEIVQLVSPQYVPLDTSRLASTYPVTSGTLQPVRHNITDYTRYENDGFLYGYRRYIIDDVSLIGNTTSNLYGPFLLKGLWSALDSSAQQFVLNLCMVSLPGEDLNPVGATSRIWRAQIPAYAGVGNSPLPAPSSNYYGGQPVLPELYYPQVFQTQRLAEGVMRQESEVILNGLRMQLNFQYDPAQGGRDFSKTNFAPIYPRELVGSIDLSSRSFEYPSGSSYYQGRPWRTPCVSTNVMYLDATGLAAPYEQTSMHPNINDGRYNFTHNSPSTNYRDLGAITGVEMPTFETRAQ